MLDATVKVLRRKAERYQQLKVTLLTIQNETASQLEAIRKPDQVKKDIDMINQKFQDHHKMLQSLKNDISDIKKNINKNMKDIQRMFKELQNSSSAARAWGHVFLYFNQN